MAARLLWIVGRYSLLESIVYAAELRAKRFAICWLIALVAIHGYREWFALADIRSFRFEMFIWQMAGFALPGLFMLPKNPWPLVAGTAVVSLYELLLLTGYLVPGGGWWVVQPIFLSALFLFPALLIGLLKVKLPSTKPDATEDT